MGQFFGHLRRQLLNHPRAWLYISSNLDWCFLPTYICFTVASIAILYLVFSNSQSIVVKLCGIFICGGELISYLLMATSNPGIANDQDDEISL